MKNFLLKRMAVAAGIAAALPWLAAHAVPSTYTPVTDVPAGASLPCDA